MKELQDRFEITALPRHAAMARDRVKRLAAHAGFTGLALDDIEVAVGEAVTNAILYGSATATSRIIITCEFQHRSEPVLQIEVHDQGQGFDPEHIRADDDTDALGGRGIRLMRALMDKVMLYYDGHGMNVRLSKILLPSSPESRPAASAGSVDTIAPTP